MSVLPPEAPGPNPGEPGHYNHHDWLTASAKALDAGHIEQDGRIEALEGIRMAVGVATITVPAAADTNGTVAVTFPSGRFKAAPKVTVTIQTSAAKTIFNAGIHAAATVSGVTLGAARSPGASGTYPLPVIWHAIEVP